MPTQKILRLSNAVQLRTLEASRVDPGPPPKGKGEAWIVVGEKSPADAIVHGPVPRGRARVLHCPDMHPPKIDGSAGGRAPQAQEYAEAEAALKAAAVSPMPQFLKGKLSAAQRLATGAGKGPAVLWRTEWFERRVAKALRSKDKKARWAGVLEAFSELAGEAAAAGYQPVFVVSGQAAALVEEAARARIAFLPHSVDYVFWSRGRAALLVFPEKGLDAAGQARLAEVAAAAAAPPTAPAPSEENAGAEEQEKEAGGADLSQGAEDLLASAVGDEPAAGAAAGVPPLDPKTRDFLDRTAASAEVVSGKTKKKISELAASPPAPLQPALLGVSSVSEKTSVSTLASMDREYMAKSYEKDIVLAAASFSDDPKFPMVVESVSREDTSDEMNMKETLTFQFRDHKGDRHQMSLDMPLLRDGRVMYVGGSWKAMRHQLLPLPVVKVSETEVRVTTNQNRVYCVLFGQRADRHARSLEKWVAGDASKGGAKWKLGDARGLNAEAPVSAERYELSKWLISVESGKMAVWTGAGVAAEKAAASGAPEAPAGHNYLGRIEGEGWLLSRASDGAVLVWNPSGKNPEPPSEASWPSVTALLLSRIKGAAEEVYGQPQGSSWAYARMSVLGRKVPAVVALSLAEGLPSVMKKSNIPWKFEPGSPRRLSPEEKASVERVRFADGVLYYPSHPISNRIMMSGLSTADTESMEWKDASAPASWAPAVEAATGSMGAVKGLDNLGAMLVDPITKEILRDAGLPTDYVGLMCYACSLLGSRSFAKAGDMSQYRVRGGEQVTAVLMQVLGEAYKAHRDAARSGSKVKMSAPKEAVIRAIQDSPSTADVAQLNPVLEAEELSAISGKGPAGMNVDDAYTLRHRAYDESMLGFLALSTPDSASVGVVRHMTMNPRIKDVRGRLNAPADPGSLSHEQICSLGEGVNSFTSTHADPPRISMAVAQTNHTLPTKNQHRPLVGTGMDKALVRAIGNDFAFKAAEDGRVLEVREDLGLATIQYSDGTTEVVDCGETLANNRGGGFFLKQKKLLSVKKGEKFKKGQVLAYNPQFFSPDQDGDHVLTVGRLSKVAMAGGDFTVEDSSVIGRRLADDLEANVTMRKAVAIGPTSNVEQVARVGQHLRAGDVLVSFDTSFEDQGANALLAKAGEDLGKELADAGKNVVRSKYSGDVVDVRVYWNREPEELSPSLRKLIDSYIARVRKREAYLKKNRTAPGAPPVPPAVLSKLGPEAKVGGDKFDGVLVEFFVEHADHMGAGDKVTYETAVKSIVTQVFEREEEPYSSFRKDEPVDAVLSPLSVVSRMTSDIYLKMYTNKVLVELKRAFAEELGLEAAPISK